MRGLKNNFIGLFYELLVTASFVVFLFIVTTFFVR